uniref:CS domain-containing protein n=1 Tax=Plasmodiophora brassicae TaxID=37360 RepID=A0A0G4IJV8_PLABS|nr:hypothetical protein PBRA_004180 [Plasmodiophora brassicae]SPR00327.1 unnamed protein product [Plasmodiophora brassicae]
MADTHSDDDSVIVDDDVQARTAESADDDGARVSALRDSVAKKGSNSYYYAWNNLDLSREHEFRPRLVKAGAAATSVPARPTVTIAKYAWSDDGKAVRVYVDLEGVGSLPADNVRSQFSARSFSIEVGDLNGTDYRLAVVELDGEAVPERCAVRVKPNMVVVSLHKAKPEHKWFALAKK